MKKRKTRMIFLVAIGLAVFCPLVTAGNLQPAAAPGSTMKTLDEVEPRIPISVDTTPGDAESIFKITESGSYYLTGNVTGEPNKSGIIVAADNVSIDLKGFTLKGVAGSVDGIRPFGYHNSNLTVVNGIVSNWGRNGVATYAGGSGHGNDNSVSYCRFEKLLVSDNAGIGIQGGYGGLIRDCIARDNGQHGITTSNNGGIIERCMSISNNGNGFNCYDGTTMLNCSSLDNSGVGIYCGNSGHTIIGCTVLNNSGGGIDAGYVSIIKDCTLRANTNFGIRIIFDCLITGNEITGNHGDGIAGVNIGSQGRSRIEANNICANTGNGINLTNNPGNFIYRNTLRNNSINLNVGAGNSAPSSSDPATAGPWHNIVNP